MKPSNLLEFPDAGDEDANKVKILVENALCNRRWSNKVSGSWFEPDPEYDFDFDRQLTVKRYLRLVNSSAYYSEPTIELPDLLATGCRSKSSELKNAPLPAYLDATGRKIGLALKIKIFGALPIHSHYFGELVGTISVRTLFYETKMCGFYYNYQLQKWEYGQSKKKLKKKRKKDEF
jgi:hypothetical protein